MALIPLAVQGDDGDPGAPGSPGAAATVTVGSVTTLAAGSPATVTNAGTLSAAVLNFGIPRGVDGDGAWSGHGSGSTANLATGNTTPTAILVPAADANYTFTIDDATYTSSALHFTIQLPRPATESTRHWLRITYRIKDRARDVGHFMYHGDHSTLSVTAHAPLVDRALIVEPGPEPGSIATLDYEWDVARRGWYVSAYTGDVRARHYQRPHLARWGEFGLPVYMSPELAAAESGTPYYGGERRTAYMDAIAAVPIATRRLLAKAGVFLDLCLLDINEGLIGRDFQNAAASSGYSGLYSNTLYATAASRDEFGSNQLRGWILQHEIGHAMDQHWPTQYGYTSPSPLGQYYGPAGTLVDDGPLMTLYYDIYTAHSTTMEGRFSNPQEWVAQVFMLAWAPRVAGYAASADWAVKRAACTGPNESDWLAVSGYLQGIGALPTPLV